MGMLDVSVRKSAITISRKVLELRMTIHDITSSLGGKYEALYGKAVAADDGNGGGGGSSNTTTNNSRRSSNSDNNNNNNSSSIVTSPRIGGRENYYNSNNKINNRSNHNNSSSSIFGGSGGGGGGSRWGIRAFGKGGRYGSEKEDREVADSCSPLGSFAPVSPAGSSASKLSPSNHSTSSARQQQRESAIDRPSFSIGGLGLGGGCGATSFWSDSSRTARKDPPNASSSSLVQPQQRGTRDPSCANDGSGGGAQPVASEETSFWAALEVCRVRS